MNYVIVIFLTLLCCLSCQSVSTNSSLNSFETTENLIDYECIFSDKETPFNLITEMAVVDDVLITQHVNDEYNFSFINTENGKIIRRWGMTGRGQEEYIEVGSGFAIRNAQLVFWDATKKEINYVSLLDLILHKKPLEIKSESYPYTLDFRPRYIDFIKNRRIAIGFFKEGYFGVLDTLNNIVPNTFDYPFAYDNIEGVDRGTVYQTKVKTNIAQNKFLIYTLASDVFVIYEDKAHAIQQVYVSPFQYVPQIEKQGRRFSIQGDKSIIGLIHSSVTDELIYFSYLGDKYDDVYQTGLASNEILCFNWQGEKVKKYILPFPISNFCVDVQYLYGVRYIDDQTLIYRFKL